MMFVGTPRLFTMCPLLSSTSAYAADGEANMQGGGDRSADAVDKTGGGRQGVR